jgi:hypothetical protein
MKEFMEYYELQPHHIPANAIVLLSSAVTLSEGYLGLWPTINFWAKYFTFWSQVLPKPGSDAPKVMVQCGAASVSPRRDSILPRVKGLDSVKKWLRSFFYVKNSTDEDKIRVAKFVLCTPDSRTNWDFNPRNKYAELKVIHKQIEVLIKDGLTSDDLLRAFISRRVSPLQQRTHKICHMSGRFDPNRTSTRELSKAEIYRRVKAIAKMQMEDDNGEWGVKPFDRVNQALRVSTRHVPLCRP